MEQLLEFEWLFGSEAEAVMEQMASEGMHRILESDNALSAEGQVLSDKSSHGSWHPKTKNGFWITWKCALKNS